MGWDGHHSHDIDMTELQKAGSVTVEKKVWNLFFAKSPADRRLELLAEAENLAKAEYGEDAVIASHRIESRWSPFSLLLSLDLIGFVEHGTITADVFIPAPPPPIPVAAPEPAPSHVPLHTSPPAPEKIVTVLYPVHPGERLTDHFGYIGLEYLTKGEAEVRAKSHLDRRDAEAEEYQKAYKKIPPGGHLLVHIGRQELMHANTLLYSYVVISGGKTIMSREGEEGIPNIRGRDGNWWNVVTIPLDDPIGESISVKITDTKIEKTYEFSVVRTEQVM